MKKNLLFSILAFSLILTGCSKTQNKEDEKIQLANPASVHCQDQGGKIEIREKELGQYGICMFDDGSECDEWVFFRKECQKGDSLEKKSNSEVKGWLELVREIDGFKIKYSKDWYYTVNHKEAKESGYNLIIGFDGDSEIWEKLPPYTVELIVLSEEQQDKLPKSGYLKIVGENNGVVYLLYSEDKENTYLIDEMAKSFEFIK